ncbi:hypothetical protein [Nocardia sp. NBC_01327]|uniref:hypothetical protein n=1 Tax=Nocardia sp. NBC_01327 TaxID=2903593 RepID=UPI002E121381|nr:hypothetical protein OG326_40210 [Nocardia sp. NBC_01327]
MSEIDLDKETSADSVESDDSVESEAALADSEPETVAAETDSNVVPIRGRKRRFALPRLPALGRGGRIAARAAVAVIAGAAVASSVFFYVQNRDKQDVLDAHQAAQSAACAYAPVLATYDAKNLDAYFTAVLDGATGEWRKQFDSTSKDLRDVLSQGQVVSKATDVQCAVRAGDRDSAEAIVVIGQTITSLGTQNKPAPGQLSMVMRLERHGDRWLVNKVNSPLSQQPLP